MATRKILSGPSKWDLLIEALGRLQMVEFDFEGFGKRQVQITTLGPEDGSGESWRITGRARAPVAAGGYAWWHSFSGHYSTKRRTGHYTLTPSS